MIPVIPTHLLGDNLTNLDSSWTFPISRKVWHTWLALTAGTSCPGHVILTPPAPCATFLSSASTKFCTDERNKAGPTCTKASGLSSWDKVGKEQWWCDLPLRNGEKLANAITSQKREEALGLVDTWGKERQKKQGLQSSKSLFPKESILQGGKQNGNCSLQNMFHIESQFAAYTKDRFHPWPLTCHVTITRTS